MKKYIFLVLCITILTLMAVADSGFISALRSCSSYSESGVFNTEGMQVNTIKIIEGWEGNKCVYKEKTSFSNINAVTTCKFTKVQLDEIISVMQAYDLVHKYSNENVDTSSLEAAKNNPVLKVWQKYLQDSSVCSISGLDGLR